MQALIVTAVGICLFWWASDGLRRSPSVMTDVFASLWVTLIFVTALN